MPIDLTNEIKLAEQIAVTGEDAATVIREALAKLAHERVEVAAVMKGIADHEAGRSRPYEEFIGEFMAERGLTPER